ncbi:tetratricopeptide repeat protein [Actinoplanes bogorensis]|uniref:Tetratricopeptide repeat protein n=1 Tax=Paractinoplanes bogorensis TaxID=1610840 RepID=A0ABS5YLL6_9ACTN|nr:FxSxx-COOH system tetratricopeptide repeat protein [Actinoplanes bogorensis]MBU2663936.1 tetratricopeptide repeat protein [Actinoplanes bogorensis]
MKRSPAAELEHALIEALVEIPFMDALPDRRLLVQLVRGDLVDLPGVEENPSAQLHVGRIVRACLSHPGGLRALQMALTLMAPDVLPSRRAVRLIEDASFHSLIPDVEMRRIRELLHRAEQGLVAEFTVLCSWSAWQEPAPEAWIFVRDVATRVNGPLRAELEQWADEQATRLGIIGEFPPRSDPSETESSPVEHDAVAPDVDSVVRDRSDEPAADAGWEGADDHHGTVHGEDMPPVAARRPLEHHTAIWGDIPQRNPNFTGREALLEDIHEALSGVQHAAVLPQALHGTGGVGKSQVAIEYVHRHSAEYDLIWWIPAERESQILSSLTQLAVRLQLDVGAEANIAVPAVREALSTGATGYRNWLLVFDNAEAPHDVQRFFPTGGAGRILVTSRDLDWSRVTRSIEVDVFTREESKAFLLGRDPGLSDFSAERLAVTLGDLPLAIEQAAAWRAATGMSVDEYVTLLEAKQIEILGTSPSVDYPDSVAAAFERSLERLRDVNPAALQLLQICSFLAPEPISRELFAGSPGAPITVELDSMLNDTFLVSRAIRDIQKYALAKIDHARNALQIHRLVRAVLLGRMTGEERIVMRRGAHTLLAKNTPNNPGHRAGWRLYQTLQPHIAESRAVESSDPRVQQLVDGMVRFLYHWGDHAGSEALAEEALGLWRASNGPSAQRTLRMAQWLGFMRWTNGKFAEARELNRQTLAIFRENFGDRDEGTIRAMHAVSIDRRTEGDFAGSRDLDERIFEIARNEFGADDPTTLVFAHSLGVSLRWNGEFERAHELDEDTHRRRVMVLGNDDEATLNTFSARLIDLRERGAFVETAPHFHAFHRRVLAAFDQNAPATLQAARQLAISLRKAGDHNGAQRLAADTLDRYRRRYGEDFPDTIATAVGYAIDLRQNGELRAARELANETVARYTWTFGARHAYTLIARTNLAVVLRLTGDLEEAYENDRTAWETLRTTLGEDHPITLACATNLASDLHVMGRYQESYERDTDTLSRSERVLVRGHPATLAVRVNLALDLRALGRDSTADKIFSDTLTSLRARLGEHHPATLNALRSIRADCDVDPMPL